MSWVLGAMIHSFILPEPWDDFRDSFISLFSFLNHEAPVAEDKWYIPMMGEVTESEPTPVEIGDKVVKIRTFSLSRNGVTVELSSLGASITRFLVPSATDEGTDDIVLGFQTPKDMFLTNNAPYFGVIVGRVANRIAKGRFELRETGETYQLETNDMPNHLHGGSEGFSQRIWEANVVDVGAEETQELPADSDLPEIPSKAVMFSLLSEDGDQGCTFFLSLSVFLSDLSLVLVVHVPLTHHSHITLHYTIQILAQSL
jgi:galactose mutarotase-like enzyme